MTKKQLKLVEIQSGEQLTQAQTQAFLQNFQAALLLSLLESDLLTQWQYELCVKEVKKDKTF